MAGRDEARVGMQHTGDQHGLLSNAVAKVRQCMSEHTGMARDSLLKKMWSSPKATT
jgi:hypothetical protein